MQHKETVVLCLVGCGRIHQLGRDWRLVFSRLGVARCHRQSFILPDLSDPSHSEPFLRSAMIDELD